MMKKSNSKVNVNGTFIEAMPAENGNVQVTFAIPNYFQKEAVKGLEVGTEYELSINPKGTQRTNRQNALMWQLLTEIADTMGMDKEEVYCLALKNAHVHSEIICAKQEAYPILKASHRAIQELREAKGMDGYMVYEVFTGSSQMSTKEMNELIDEILKIAEKVGINYRYWGSLLV